MTKLWPHNICPADETLVELRRRSKSCSGRDFLHTPLDMVRFVIIDLETTGFEADNGDEVISLGAVLVHKNKICMESSLDLLVDPCREIPENIIKLTGIDNDMVKGRPSVYNAVIQFLTLLEDGVIAGHALGFDLGFINYKLSLRRAGKIESLIFDTKIVARYLYPLLPDYSLDSLLKACGIQPAGRHTALGDCLLTAGVLLHQLAELRHRGINSLHQLFNVLDDRKSTICF
ncbi:MAG: 3'-5' exonuclease [Firmicutes bacterium]|nr:3'-5' exonuclease [Bacillota bacterium]